MPTAANRPLPKNAPSREPQAWPSGRRDHQSHRSQTHFRLYAYDERTTPKSTCFGSFSKRRSPPKRPSASRIFSRNQSHYGRRHFQPRDFSSPFEYQNPSPNYPRSIISSNTALASRFPVRASLEQSVHSSASGASPIGSPHDAHAPTRSKKGQTTFRSVISKTGPRLRALLLTACLHELDLHRPPQTCPERASPRRSIRIQKIRFVRLPGHRYERKRARHSPPPHQQTYAARLLRLMQPRFKLSKARLICHAVQHRVRFCLGLERNRLLMFLLHCHSSSIAADVTRIFLSCNRRPHVTREIVNAALQARKQTPRAAEIQRGDPVKARSRPNRVLNLHCAAPVTGMLEKERQTHVQPGCARWGHVWNIISTHCETVAQKLW